MVREILAGLFFAFHSVLVRKDTKQQMGVRTEGLRLEVMGSPYRRLEVPLSGLAETN